MMVHQRMSPNARCTNAGPSHAVAQYADRNALDRAHPTRAQGSDTTIPLFTALVCTVKTPFR
jgi:hypothetical protein